MSDNEKFSKQPLEMPKKHESPKEEERPPGGLWERLKRTIRENGRLVVYVEPGAIGDPLREPKPVPEDKSTSITSKKKPASLPPFRK